MTQQQRQRGTAEQLDVANHLRFAQAAQERGQVTHDRLQGLYQHRAVVDGDDVLAGFGAKSDVEMFRLVVPTHRNPCPAPVAEFRPGQRRSPVLGLHARDPLQLFGQQALLERQLIGMGQVLQVAAATAVEVLARGLAARRAGIEHPLQAGLDHLAVGIEYPRFDLFLGQGATDEPGATVEKGNATAVASEALDAQALLLAGGDLWRAGATGRLKAQAAVTFVLGHQFTESKMPVDR
ncbi:hypothetical protein D3C76_986070 [compost metagenome]